MDTRMSKYEEKPKSGSRVARNTELYEKINNTEIENFTLRSNATVIGNQEPEIDVEKIKKILDTKYNKVPQRKSIRIEEEYEEEEENEAPTKEYDLNLFLEKAKDEKEETYEEVRAKKLKDTQFDILKNLHIDESIEEDEEVKRGPRPEDNDLLNLINTITINENREINKEENKNTIENEIKEETDNIPNIDEQAEEETIAEIKNEIEKVETSSKVLSTVKDIDNSFYTESNVFKKNDFADDDEDTLSVGMIILIVVVVIGILVGLFFFLKTIIKF